MLGTQNYFLFFLSCIDIVEHAFYDVKYKEGEKCAKKKFSYWKSSGGAETRRLYWLWPWRLLLIVSGCLYHPKYHVLLLRCQLPELLHKRAFSFCEPIVLDGGLCFFASKEVFNSRAQYLRNFGEIFCVRL